jgi:hypothetical protein
MTSTYTKRKAQSAFEFIFIFGIFLSALVVSMWVSSTKTAEIGEYNKNLLIDDLLLKVTEKINTAWIEGEGFSTNVTLPALVASSEYGISVSSNFVIVTVSGEHYIRGIITENVTGNLTVGGVSTLRNTGDAVEIL